MKWRYILAIIRIALVVILIVSIFIGLQEEFAPARMLHLATNQPRALVPYSILIFILGIYNIYMFGNAIREFRSMALSFKALYIITTIIILLANTAMIVDFIKSNEKALIIKRDVLGDGIALLSLLFSIIDFFPFFISKKYDKLIQKSHRFSTDDYKEITPE